MSIDLSVLRAVSPEGYASASPFPHLVVKGLFDRDLLLRAAAEYPSLDAMGRQYESKREVKSAESRWDRFGPAVQEIISELNSGTFVEELQRISGIDGLVVDAGLYGGGQHQIGPGGFLGVHADFNVHPTLGLYRRLNALVYLNDEWDESFGGYLELWGDGGPEVSVAPEIGTVVIFTTTDEAMHGHPHPLTCPEGRSRRSIATYYYTVKPHDSLDIPRSTLFRGEEGGRIKKSFQFAAMAAKSLIRG